MRRVRQEKARKLQPFRRKARREVLVTSYSHIELLESRAFCIWSSKGFCIWTS